ncbi:MAG: hypothetical protein V4677_03115 [Bacteroidota bacterium]
MKSLVHYIFIFLLLLAMSGCAVVGGIFKAGMIWGIILVVGIVGLIIYLISGGRRK